MTTQTTKDFDDLREKVESELAKKTEKVKPKCHVCDDALTLIAIKGTKGRLYCSTECRFVGEADE